MKPLTLRSRYYFSRLSDFEKRIYREIYDSWVTGGSVARITLPEQGFCLPGGLELHRLVQFILNENPNLFHLEPTQLSYVRSGDEITISAKNVYTSEEFRDVCRKLEDRISGILRDAGTFSTDYEKMRYLHDYLVKNVIYDRGKPDLRSQREVHTIVGALLNGACVCDGYARAFRLLCDHLQLSCVVVIGEADGPNGREAHAWNFARMDGRVYHVDVTWDSTYFAKGYPVTDYYFLRSDGIFSGDHGWDSGLYPPVTQDYPRAEPLVSDKQELEKQLCDRYRAGERRILLRFPEDFPGTEALVRLTGDVIQRHPWLFRKGKQPSVVYYRKLHYGEVRFL